MAFRLVILANVMDTRSTSNEGEDEALDKHEAAGDDEGEGDADADGVPVSVAVVVVVVVSGRPADGTFSPVASADEDGVLDKEWVDEDAGWKRD